MRGGKESGGGVAEQRRSVEEVLEVSTVKDGVEVSLRVSGSYLLQISFFRRTPWAAE